MLIAHNNLLRHNVDGQWVFLNAEKHFYLVKNALSEGVIELMLNLFCHNIAALFYIWT